VKRAAAGCALLAAALHAAPSVADDGAETVRLFTDNDDDDDDGVEDRASPTPWTARDLVFVEGAGRPLRPKAVPSLVVRVVTDREVLAPGARTVAYTRLGLQGLSAGRTEVDLDTRRLDVVVCELSAREAGGAVVDLATSHASLSRTLPSSLAKEVDGSVDHDALAWLAVCPRGFLPGSISVTSFDPSGARMDRLMGAPLTPMACPNGTGDGLECAESEPIRATADAVDRLHPAARARSLRAEVGGRLVVLADGRKAASIRVGGPRRTALGSLGRFSAKLRVHVLRASAAGQSSVGGDERGALGVASAEVHTAGLLWGQCGIHFERNGEPQARVVDPPGPYLLAVGCEAGLPASGGVIAFAAEGKPIRVSTRASDAPVAVAHAVARAVEAAGLRATVSPSTRISFGAERTADVLVHRPDGTRATLSQLAREPLSSDRTLSACIGEVDLSDGLTHFDDLDAAAGTLEERALAKAYQDDDASTVEVFIVPSFSKTGRIGESFIDTDGSGIQNVVIVDRAGIRAGARSYVLAHELGHVFLDMPGHPDDFGVDQPWMLMDADATDGSIFGPRRISVDDCERAVRESGPRGLVPLLEAWPLYRERVGAKTMHGR
jgi:hypothetical protein